VTENYAAECPLGKPHLKEAVIPVGTPITAQSRHDPGRQSVQSVRAGRRYGTSVTIQHCVGCGASGHITVKMKFAILATLGKLQAAGDRPRHSEFQNKRRCFSYALYCSHNFVRVINRE
jgi:hypothetical protein